MNKYLVVNNEDKRFYYLINKLKENHEVNIVDDQASFEKMIKVGKYTHLLLPITGVDNTLSIRGCKMQFNEELFAYLKGKTILTGLVIEPLTVVCQTYDVNLKSYITDDFAIENNYITCEGIIERLVNLSTRAIYGSNTIIIGYGRLGQILANILKSMKVHVIIAARSPKDRTTAKVNGFTPIHLTDLCSTINQVDFVINTVPVEVIDHTCIDAIENDDLIILDASSKPYGFDLDYANKKNIAAFILPQIPGKVAPKSSGEIMAKYISLQ